MEVPPHGFADLLVDVGRDLDRRSELDDVVVFGGFGEGRCPRWDFGVEEDVSVVRWSGDEEVEVMLFLELGSSGLSRFGVEGEVGIGVEVLLLFEIVEGVATELSLSVLLEEEGRGSVHVDESSLLESSDPFAETNEEDVDVVGGVVELFREGETVVEGDD